MRKFLAPRGLLFAGIALFCALVYSPSALAQTSVTAATAANLCVGGSSVTLTNITVAETANNGFNNNQTNATMILTAPSGFIFSSPNTVTITPSSGNIFNVSAAVTASSSLTITLSTNGATATDNFVIGNLQLQAVSTASTGNITRLTGASAGGSFNVSGAGGAARGSGVSYGNLTSVLPPTVSIAGPDQNKCATGTFTMAANTPTSGTGAWSVVSGSASITTASSPTTNITAVAAGSSATLRWTISNGACTASTDDIIITNYAAATASAAGADLFQCSNGTFTLNGNNPVSGTGVWTVQIGTATIVSPTTRNSQVLGVPVNSTATLRWTITNGSCSSFDDVALTNNPAPTPVISGSNSVCANVVGVTYSTPNVVGHTYVWAISGGAITAGAGTNSITVTWGGVGTGTLSVAETITATTCVVTTSNYNVSINAVPTPVIAGSITACSNQTGVVYNTALVGGHSYVWTISGGTITAGAGTNSVTVTWGGAGTGSVSVVETVTASGCSAGTAPYNVTVNPLPTPVISGSNSVCANVVGVTYSTPNVVGHTYVWAISGGAITAGAGTNSVTVTWGGVGTGTLSVAETITATTCAVTTSNYNVSINAVPTPVIAGSITACSNQTGVVYNTALVGGHSYVWTISGGTITAGAGTNSVTVTWGGAGTGSVSVVETVTASGCSAGTAPYNVTVNPLPTPVISGSNSVCANVVGVTYSTPNVVGHTYVWAISGGAITAGAGTNSVTVTWGGVGTGTLSVAETITATTCAVTTSNYNVSINAVPTPVIAGSITACSNQTGVVYNTALVGGHSYVWTISGGTITAGAGTNSVTVTWGGAGTGSVSVVETVTASGCSAGTAPYNVTVNPLPTPVISGSNSVCANVVGVTYSTPNVVGHTYVWAISGGAITAGAGTNSVTVTWGGVGTGTLSVAETITATTCAVTTSNYNVSINAVPTPVIAGSITACSNQTGVVYNTALVGGHSYVWTISGGTITAGAGTNSVTVTWGGAGTGSVSVVETVTASGCSAGTAPYNVTVNPLPTPVISGSNSVCANVVGVTYSTPNVVGHTYVWAISGGAITAGAGTNSVTVTWGGVGTGTLSVAETITATTCVVTTSNYNVSINAVPTPVIAGSITACSNQTGVVYNTALVGGHSYVWTISGGTITAGAGTNSVTVTWGGAGTGSVSVVETVTASGCSAGTAPYNVTVNPLPTPVISGSNSVCANVVGVTYSTPNVVGHTYVWAISGGAITAGAGTNSVTVTWGGVGTGTLSVAETITATTCVVTTSNYNVSINAVPTPVIAGSITACSNQTGVVYNTALVGGHSYVWTISGGTITAGAGTNSVTVTWGGAGTGSVSVVETVTASGCSAGTAPYNVTVNPLPTPVISGSNKVCENAIGVDYSTPGVVGDSYLWLIIGGTITSGAGTNAITVDWGSAGSGTLRVIETITATSCSVTTSNYDVTINANPIPIIAGSITACSNQTGVVYNTALVGGHSYVWTISGGTITAGAGTNSVTVTWGGAGTGSISVVETVTASGCSAGTAPYNVTVNPLPTPLISGLNSVCENVPGIIYSTSNVGGHTYVWAISGGAITAGAGTNSITVTWGSAGAGTLTVAETITATGCAVTTANYNVTINTVPAAVITGSNTACANQGGVGYSTPFIAGHSYVWTISNGTITAGAGTNSITVAWGAAGTGSLSVAETSAAGCGATTAPYNVTINPLPTPVISGSNSVCATVAGINYSTPNIVGHTYVWAISGGSITAGAGTNSVTVTWGIAGTGTLTIAETITATGCAVTTPTYNVTIGAIPTPTISGATTACANQSGVGYSTPLAGGSSYVWSISGGVITAGAGTNAVSVTWDAAGTGSLTLIETVLASGCSVTTSPYNVTINPLPTPVISGLNSVCANVIGVNYSTLSVGGHTYVWTISGGAITAGAGTNNVTVTWGGAGIGTLTVAETITATGCAVTTGNYNVTINANPTPVISGTTPVCSGQTGVNYSTLLVGGHSYVWTIAGGTITAGAGTNSVTVTWGASGAGQLTVAETITATGCVVTTSPFNVTINPVPVFSVANTTGAGTGLICSGSPISITLTSPTPGATITLQSVVYGALTGGLYSAGGTFTTGSTIVEGGGGLVNPTNAPITVTYVFSAATPSCSNPVTQQTTVTVNPTPAMSIVNGTSAICSGSAVTITLNSPTSGAVITLNSVTYGLASGTIIAPKTYTPGSVIAETLTNSTSSPVIVTYSFSVSANGCTTVGPFTTNVTVSPIPTVNALPLNTTLCGGQQTNITLTNPNSVSGGVVYNWTASVLSGTVIGQSNQTGGPATSIIQTLTTNNVGGIIRYTITATATTGGCTGLPVTADVTVNPVPNASVGGASTAALCSGATANIILQNPNSVSGTSFIWTASVFSGVASGFVNGSGSGISQPLTTTSAGGVVRYVITPVANGCNGTSINWDVTVNPVPASSSVVEPNICSGTVFSFDPQLEITNGVVSSFSWTAVYPAGLSGPAGGSGLVAGNLVNITGGVLSAVYTVTPTAPGPGSCVGPNFTITVPVKPEPVGTIATTAQQCSDISFSINPQSFISNGIISTFNWTATYAGGLAGGTPSGSGNLTGTITNETGGPLNASFNVTPLSAGGCTGAMFTITVPINSEPKGVNATATAICSGSSVNYNLQTNVNGVNGMVSNFSWVAANNTNVGGESSTPKSGPVINDILTNVTGTNQTVIYTVTPTSLSGCQGNNFTIDIAVRSVPVGSNSTTASVCSASPFSFNGQVNITNGMSSTFIWTVTYAAGITGGAGAGNGLVAETLSNITSTPLNATYTLIPTAGGCSGAPFTITVPIDPQPTGVAQSLTRCSTSTVNTILTTTAGSPVASSYSISVNANGLTQTAGTPSSGSLKAANELQDDVWKNVGSVAVTVVYTITPITAAGCVGNSFVVQVSVNPEPVGVAQSVTICSDLSVNYNLLNNIAILGNNVGSTFSWVAAANPNVSNESTTPQSGSVINDMLDNVTSSDQTVIYSVTPTAVTGCAGTSFQINVLIHPEPLGLTTTIPAICSGSAVNYDLQANVNGANGVPSSFTWLAASNPNTGGESTSPQTGSIITDVLTNTTFSAQTVIYTATPSGLNGCAGDPFTITIDVNPKAVVSAGPDLAVCANNPSKQLQGLISYAPAGVVWSGGVGGFSNTAIDKPDYFYANPAEVTMSVTLTLTATDPDGIGGPCSAVADQMVLKINALPNVGFFGLPTNGTPPHIAENIAPITLNAIQAGGLFTIVPGSGLGSTFVGSTDGVDHVVFDPSAATVSVLNDITYSYTDANSCTNSVTHGIIVDQITSIDFKVDSANLSTTNDWEICSHRGLQRLIGFPDVTSGGGPETQFSTFPAYVGQTPPLISKIAGQYYLQTDGLPSDTYVIQYDYKNTLGAISTKIRNVVIFAAPTAIMNITNSCIASPVIFNDASTLPTIAGSPATPPPAPSINSWLWTFDDFSANSPLQNTTHQYLASGLYNVRLRVSTAQGCVSTATQTIRVGDIPIVDFSWKSICTNDSTRFKDKTDPGGLSNIVTYSWEFDDARYPGVISGPTGGGIPLGTDGGNTSGHYKQPNHAFLPGLHDVTLTVQTNDGCVGDSTKKVFILPTQVVQPMPTSSYFEQFETTTHGWQAESIDSLKPLAPNSWILGTPNGTTINSTSSGSNSWWTGKHVPVSGENTTYYPNEKTAVNGPCFNLSTLERPMIALNYWVDTQRDFDGAVIQYSTDGGDTWNNVGLPLQGINWYTNELIISNPGNQGIGLGPYGWTGESGKWLNARSSLDVIPIADRNQVRIRVALASDASTLPTDSFDGFAFDDVFVGDKTRNVLLEEFTNSTLGASGLADTYLDDLYNNQAVSMAGVHDFFDIRYHVSFPTADQYNLDNPADPGARGLFYSVTQPPFAIMDGRLDNSFTGDVNQIDAAAIDRRALSDPGFSLNLTSSSVGNKISVKLDMKAMMPFSGPLIAQVALVENVGTGPGATNKVVRKLLFGPDGKLVNHTWTVGQPDAVSITNYELRVPIVDPTKLKLVAFVQDMSTKEIYQSLVVQAPAVDGGPVTGIDEPTVPGLIEQVQLFPNPANGNFNFKLPDNFPDDYSWSIADQRGITVLSGDFSGASGAKKNVTIEGLPSGVYFVIIGAPDKQAVYRKLVIMNRN